MQQLRGSAGKGWLARQNIIMLRVTTSDHLPAEGVFEEAKPDADAGV